MSDFTHLHVHTHYSLLDGLPKIDELLNYTKELGMDSVAITDHGTMYGAIEFYQKAKEVGIKPIIGQEFYFAKEKMTQRRPNIDDARYHLILLAKNFKGYQNLVELTSKAWLDGFYYKPRIDEELLEKYTDNLICMTACIQGKIPRLILSGKIDEAEKLAKKYKEMFEKDSFYLEIQSHPSIPEQEKANKAMIEMSKKFDIPLVATNDVHYLKKEDSEAQDILMLINTNAKPDDPERLTMKNENLSFKKEEEFKKAFKNVPEAIKNTKKIAEMCSVDVELNDTKLPHFKVPNGEKPDKYLEELCQKGIKERFKKETPEVKERLKYELSVIEKMNFSSYFLIVWDFVNWAKENGIVVGPGRGSASGSLVSYLLNITEVDPLKYDLLFERFLNPDRAAGLPDIDLDFADTRRDEVIEYVAKKYGQDKVARIITFGTMAAKQVIRDVGRSLGYNYTYCDRIAKMIPLFATLNESIGRVAEFRQIYKTDPKAKKMIDIGKKLEGVARHASTHACGVVIADNPLTELIPLQRASQNGDETIITQYEMHTIEKLGLLKMDLLGLKNLTIIEETLKLVKKLHKINIDISKLPLDDKESYKLLRDANTTGVFQLESDGMKRYLKELKPTIFEDIIAMVALYRPGPMEFIPEYIARKHGTKQVEYLDVKLKPILESTFGICIFQEQLMRIARELAEFTMAEADFLRKAVGKKIRSLLLEQKEKFVGGMIKNGFNKSLAQKIWNWVIPFARYGFNKAHATAYAMIAYQTAYLKAHYPIEFMTILMNTEQKNLDRLRILLEETKKMKIEVLPPDINESLSKFTIVDNDNIRFGLTAIKNVGQNVVEKIVEERKKDGQFNSIENFVERMPKEVLNKKSIESLIKSGTFDNLEERGKLLYNLEKILEYARSSQKTKENGDMSLFGGGSSAVKIKLEENKEKITEDDKITWEKELLGVFVSSHPMDNFKEKVKNHLSINDLNHSFANQRVKVAGVISKIQKIITKQGEPMLFLEIEDLTGKIEILVFPGMLKENPLIFQENKVIEVKGRISDKDGDIKIITESAKEIKNGK